MRVPYCVCVLLILFIWGHDSRAQEKRIAQKEPEPQTIPKNEVFTTSVEQGFKDRLVPAFRSTKDGDKPAFPYSFDLKMINQDSQGMGASNIFIVRGDDVAQAVASTRLVFVTGGSADTPPENDISAKKIKSEKLWLVAYLGSAWSGPPKWRFKSANVNKQSIEFAYSTVMPAVMTGDGLQYFYWVPLPPLKKGTYELKLRDADKGRPVLIRYVDVP